MITVVSGLPRSGTSMMMQMLAAGGMPVLVDDKRQADDDNPRGYYEFDPVKRLQQDDTWVSSAEGSAVKVVSPLLKFLPSNFEYRIILMCRDLDEVVRSQEQMLKRNAVTIETDSSTMQRHFERHTLDIRQWLADQKNIKFIECRFADIVDQPELETTRVAKFLESDFDQRSMIQVIEPKLYRQQVR